MEQATPGPIHVRGRDFVFGSRTYVMGIINVTPDSFSGDGLMQHDARCIELARRQARAMASAGADLLDIGGESTRPGHASISVVEELDRVVGIVRAIREALPTMPLSIDTSKVEVASAALDAGADIINDVAAVTAGAALAPLAASLGVPYILMHGRPEARYDDVVAEVTADLAAALAQARAAGCRDETLIVDPGIGFGKTAAHNLSLLRRLGELRSLGRPVLLGASRKSTIGHVLDLPPSERLEGTLATTALGIAQRVDIVRVHDVEPNVRVARMADAIVRGQWQDGADDPAAPARSS
jgi:dihydropteroate synthase